MATPGFDHHNLPYCSFVIGDGDADSRLGVRLGDHVLDLEPIAKELDASLVGWFAMGNLDRILGGTHKHWAIIRKAIVGWVTDEKDTEVLLKHAHPIDRVILRMPFTVKDYVDFYASEQHALNVGKIFRPQNPDLPAAWKQLPIGYHGRSGTLIVSGTDIKRPHGLRRVDGAVEFGPCRFLDIEAEMGFVCGNSTDGPIDLAKADEHVFGAFILNDWSARDIQAFEYVPLGPFLGKSFATSISPWVVPMEALLAARVPTPVRDEPLSDYLDDQVTPPSGLDVALEVLWNGDSVSKPPFKVMYYSYAQMATHMVVNGASLRAGDVFGSGTISGSEVNTRGSFLELTWNGAEPITLSNGDERKSLVDGDVIEITATAPGPDGSVIDFGSVIGRIVA